MIFVDDYSRQWSSGTPALGGKDSQIEKRGRVDSLELIRVFREIVVRGSFSSAAKNLGVSKATVSKYVAALEARLGVRLLNRSTRSVSLTDAGQVLLERSAPMLELIELTQAELTARANKPKGRLRIAAPYAMSNGTFPNLLADFMGYYPEVSLSLHLVNEVDLVEDAIDVQLRFGPILDENVIVRRLLQMPMVVCASPGYWKKRGMPQVPDDLRKHDALTLLRQGLSPVWRFESEGETVNVSVRSVMEATEVHPLIQVALRGFGVIYAPVLAVQLQLERGELVPAIEMFSRKDMWLSAAYAQRRHNSAAQKALLDFLQTRLGDHARR